MVKIDKTTKALADKYWRDQQRRLGLETKDDPPPADVKQPRHAFKPRLKLMTDDELAGGIFAFDEPGFMNPHEPAPQVDLQAIWEHFNAL